VTVETPAHRSAATGKNTGIAFGFYRDNPAFARELAAEAHQYCRIGWEEGVRQLVFRKKKIKYNSVYDLTL